MRLIRVAGIATSCHIQDKKIARCARAREQLAHFLHGEEVALDVELALDVGLAQRVLGHRPEQRLVAVEDDPELRLAGPEAQHVARRQLHGARDPALRDGAFDDRRRSCAPANERTPPARRRGHPARVRIIGPLHVSRAAPFCAATATLTRPWGSDGSIYAVPRGFAYGRVGTVASAGRGATRWGSLRTMATAAATRWRQRTLG